MALPTLQRKLFQNDGYGPLLKDEIVSRHISVQDWSNAYDYPVATVVRGSDGLLYYSVAQSGPGVASGAQDPVADSSHAYWASPKVPAMPVADSSGAVASTEWVNNWFSNGIVLPQTLYVDAVNGSDDNDGYSEGTALKTVGALLSLVGRATHIRPSYINVNFAQGSYSESLHGVTGTTLHCTGLGNGVSFPEIYSDQDHSLVLYGKLSLGSMSVSRGGVVRLASGVSLDFVRSLNTASSVGQIIYVYMNGLLTKYAGASATIKFSGSWSVTGSTILAQYGGIVALYGSETWSGSVTGKRYAVAASSVLSGIGSATAIPGSTAGTVDASSYFN